MRNSYWLRVCSVLIIVVVCRYLPLYHDFTIIQIVHGIIGHLSYTSLILSLMWLINYIVYNKKNLPITISLANIIVISGAWLYLSTLGFISFDAYATGYQPSIIWLLIIDSLILYFVYYKRLYAYIILFNLIIFHFGLGYSNNLWDYLFDPILWFICIYYLIYYHYTKWCCNREPQKLQVL